MRLVALEGTRAGSELALGPGPLVFGRAPECDVPLDDPDVSREHCRLSPAPTGYVIEDLGSRNGTILNGRRIDAPAPLRDGDLIVVGQSVFEVRPAAAAIGPPRLPAPTARPAAPEPFSPPLATVPPRVDTRRTPPAGAAAAVAQAARNAARAGEQLLARLDRVVDHLAAGAPRPAALGGLLQGGRPAEADARRVLAACERAGTMSSPYQRADLLLQQSDTLRRALAAALDLLHTTRRP